MNNLKLKFNSRKLTSFISLCLFVLFTLTLTFTSLAWSLDKKFAGGVIKFGDIGIEAVVKNLTSSSVSGSGTSLGTAADFHLYIGSYNDTLNNTNYDTAKELDKSFFNNVKQGDSLTILNPSIEPSKNTTSYFLRSRWQVKVNNIEIPENNLEQANVLSLPQFSSEWVKKGDFYYYVGTEKDIVTDASDLKLNNYNTTSSGEVKFFDESELKIKIVDDGFDINIEEIEVNLIFEVIEANLSYVNTEWFA